jgi:uncharacterized protein (DUF1697 family)
VASLRSVRYTGAREIDMKSVILLRGINVGGHGKLPMKELCVMLEGLGAVNPQSYIQSGNVVIEVAMEPEAVADVIEDAKGFRPSVMVFLRADFMRATDESVFNEPDGKLLHIWFTASAFTFDQEKADSLRAESESLHVTERAIWLHAPNGVGRSKLAAKVEVLAGVACTARNMNTVRKLREMLDG